MSEMQALACTTCGGDPQPGTAFECADCEGTGFEQETKVDILEELKSKLAYDGAAVMVTHSQLTDVIEEITLLRETLKFYADKVLAYSITQILEPRSAVHADGGRRARAARTPT